MTKTLVIVRHGNTFLPEQIPTRVGIRTDLPLVEEARSRAVGKYLLKNNIIPDVFFAAPLKRTRETAELIIKEMELNKIVEINDDFSEIDYGPDEDKPEHEVMMRLGREFLKDKNTPSNIPESEIIKYGENIINLWNAEAIVPHGWIVDVNKIIRSWKNLVSTIKDKETVLISTSNGIIRFAPYVLDGEYKDFSAGNDIKVATGSVSIFKFENNKWVCYKWNEKPYKLPLG